MKTKMSLMVLSTLGLLMSQVGQAHVGPVLRPEFCEEGKQIIFPEGANGTIYMSDDCKTAYVLPDEKSPLEINALATSPGVNQKDCTRVEQLADEEKYWEDLIKKQQKDLAEIYADFRRDSATATSQDEKDKVAERYMKLKSSIEKSMQNDQKSLEVVESRGKYATMEGMAINFHLALKQGQVVNRFTELNKDSGIIFRAAPISKGILSFNNGSDTEIKYRRVLSAKIPGFAPDLSKQEVQDVHVNANGGMSGMIKLSQPAVCDILKKIQPEGQVKYDANLLLKDPNLIAGFVANYIYEVPVSTSVGFKLLAKTSGNDLSVIFNKHLMGSREKSSEVSTLLMEGGLEDKIKVSFNDGGIPFTLRDFLLKHDSNLNQNQENLINVLLLEGLEMYKDKVLTQLEFMGQIQKEAMESAQDIPAPQEVAKVRSVQYQSCSSKRVLGVKVGSKCKTKTRNETYYVPGHSFGKVLTNFNQEVGIDMELSANQTIPMIHTTGFAAIKE